MLARQQLDQIESTIVRALAGRQQPRFLIPARQPNAMALWLRFVQEITGSYDAFLGRFAERIEAASSDRLRLQRDTTPPSRFRTMEGLVDQDGNTVFQFFVGDYSPVFRGFSR